MARPTPLTLTNPTLDPPRLYSSPSKRQSFHSRSRSVSPTRAYAQARELDPLLRDLSPTATLSAFSFGGNNENANPRNSFVRSLDSSTASQCALGAKAAQACLDVRSWARELEAWEWPGTFDVPEPARKRQRRSLMSIGSLASRDFRTSEEAAEEEDAFWGSLPAKTVQEYEGRVDEIVQQLEDVDVEELKSFVLAAHGQAGSGVANMDYSIGSIGAATDLRRLDDFTAVVTATILQALPYLSKLNRLLDVWTIRIGVLRQTPAFLKSLKQAITDLDHGWAAIAVARSRDEGGPDRATFTRESMREMQRIVERSVTDLGRRLDGFLDDLEGREETVPENWIEDLELLEEKYAQWTVRAERKAFENEMRMSKMSLPLAETAAEEYKTEIGEQELDDRSSGKVSMLDPNVSAGISADASRTVSPIGVERNVWEGPTMSFPPPDERLEQKFPTGLTKDDSHALPADQASRIIGDGSSSVLSSPSKYEKSRHVPIVISYDGDGQEYPTEGITGDPTSRSMSPAITSPISIEPPKEFETPATSIVKKRAAFLGDVSRKDSLQRTTKSPVRPFEHASNAFTRLFKKDPSASKSPATPEDRSRSNSVGRSKSVRSSDSRRRSGSLKDFAKGFGAKSDEPIVWGGRGSSSPTRPASKRNSGDGKVAIRPRSKTTDDGPKRADADAPPVPVLPKSATVSARASTEVPPVYQPSRLLPPFEEKQDVAKEPFQGFDFGENWPLVSPEPSPEPHSPVNEEPPQLEGQVQVQVNDEGGDESEAESSSPEISSPKKPMESDAFHRMFVESFPASPTDRAHSPAVNLEEAINRADSGQRQMHSPPPAPPDVEFNGVPTLEVSMLGDSLPGSLDRTPSRTTSFGVWDSDRSGAGTRASSLQFPQYKAAEEGGTSACGRSREESPERVAEALSSKGPVTPEPEPETLMPGVAVSDEVLPEVDNNEVAGYFPRQASSGASRRSSITGASPDQRSVLTAQSAVPAPLKLKIPDSDASPGRDPPAQAAGVQDVKEQEREKAERPSPINRASMASIESYPRSEVKAIDVPRRSNSSVVQAAPTSPYDSPRSPVTHRIAFGFPSPPVIHEARSQSPVLPLEESPERPRLQELTPSPQAPAQLESSPEADRGDLNTLMAKRRGQANGTPRPLPKNRTPKPTEGDAFDRHISEVLENIPAPIRFRSGAQTPFSRTSEPRNYSGPRPKTARIPSRASSGALTLAPADPAPRKPTTAANEPEVKLYHLTQAGREEPIKLFVRLVGEGERVMVRVGGGWADLAEYLRQYAEHHGSRTVSEGTVNLNVHSAAPAPRRVSGSSAGDGKVGAARAPATPVVAHEGSDEHESAEDSPMLHPSYTPSKPPSRPSTAGTSASKASHTSSRPSSRQAWSEVGMAGPGATTPGAGKKPELDEHKAKWVEGMLERVQKASAEKSREEQEAGRKFFGEMGRVGGTRRVVFRKGGGANGKE